MSGYRLGSKKLLRASVDKLEKLRASLVEQRDEWAKKYYVEHQKIVDLALEHSPKLDAGNEDGLPGFGKTISLFDDKQPKFTCNAKGCNYFWPCPTYLWATGSERFTVVIERKAQP